MKRLLTIITPLGLERRTEILSRLDDTGATLISRKCLSIPLLEESDEKLFDLLKKAKESDDHVVNALVSCLEGGDIEAAIWELAHTSQFELTGDDNLFSRISEVSSKSICLYTTSDSETTKYGGFFFWQDCYDPSRFVTSNTGLFQYDYLPVELAKDGTGIFFDERILNRLIELGFVDDSDEVLVMEDLGGWEDLQNLTARLRVKLKREARTFNKTLQVTALVPPPPVSPESLARTIRERYGYLSLLDIRTSVLHAGKGLVYEQHIPHSLVDYILGTQNKNIVKIVGETAALAAILDSGCFNMANVKIGEASQVTDLLVFSDEASLERQFDLNFLDVLRTDGELVYWADLGRNLAAYGPGKEKLNIEKLVEICPTEELAKHALKEYQSMMDECVHRNWLTKKLFG